MTRHHQTPEWYRFTRRARPLIAAMLPLPCVDCGHPVMPDQTWQVGHIVAAAHGGTMTMDNVGPSHGGKRGCNQRAGGRLGAQLAGGRRRAEQDIRPW